MGFLSALFFLASFVLAYFVWIRPILRTRPACTSFYDRADTFWEAVWMKMRGIKTKLASALVMISSALVGLHDFVMPVLVGIEWDPVTRNVPAWVWPVAAFGIGLLFKYLRDVTERQHKEEKAAISGIDDGDE